MSTPRRTAPGPFGDTVGRPRSHGLVWLVVIAAGAADVVTFYQVLILVLNVPETLVWVAVVGFTAASLALAHHAGQKARQALSPRYVVGSITLAWLSGAVWLMLGLLAFTVRYVIADSSGTGAGSIAVIGGPAAPPTDSVDLTSQHLAALMFLGLYVATGFVTGLGGFMRLDPAAAQFARARSQQAKLVRSLGGVRAWLTTLDRELGRIDAIGRRTEEERRQAEALCDDLAEQLKAKARVRLMTRRALDSAPPSAHDPAPVPGTEADPDPGSEPDQNSNSNLNDPTESQESQ